MKSRQTFFRGLVFLIVGFVAYQASASEVVIRPKKQIEFKAVNNVVKSCTYQWLVSPLLVSAKFGPSSYQYFDGLLEQLNGAGEGQYDVTLAGWIRYDYRKNPSPQNEFREQAHGQLQKTPQGFGAFKLAYSFFNQQAGNVDAIEHKANLILVDSIPLVQFHETEKCDVDSLGNHVNCFYEINSVKISTPDRMADKIQYQNSETGELADTVVDAAAYRSCLVSELNRAFGN